MTTDTDICFQYGNALQNPMLTAIAELKSQQWNYPMVSQIAWLRENVGADDVHVLQYRDGILAGYLRITPRPMTCSGASYVSGGVGTVIIDRKFRRRGYGRKMMIKANEFIVEKYNAGILFTTKINTAFYRNCGWAERDRVSVRDHSGHIVVAPDDEICMVYDPRDILDGEVVLHGEKF